MKLYRNMTLFTPVDRGRAPHGQELGAVERISHAAILCQDGKISRVGAESEVLKGLNFRDVTDEVDCGGACVIPGFVDSHTHICFAGRREEEFALRLRGATYLEILTAGGGILSSARAVQVVSEDELFEETKKNALRAMASGTTTIEIKSGYGLDLENELKMLRVIERIRRSTGQDVVSTFMGAHALPEHYSDNPQGYVREIVNEMLPEIKKQDLAQFCDVFCEQGVFSLEQSFEILSAAGKLGLGLKIHADEINDLGGAELAAELHAISAEHLLATGDKGFAALAREGVIATFLPATAYSLKKPYARARRAIELGVSLAIATDCNPGSCFCESMPFVFSLAVTQMDLTIEEALTAATLGGACAIGMRKQVGSLDVGKNADFLVLDGETPAILAYHVGGNPVSKVVKRGVLVRATATE